jgi:hypothetical protein
MKATREKTDCPVTVHMREDEARKLIEFLNLAEVAKVVNQEPTKTYWYVWASLSGALMNELWEDD